MKTDRELLEIWSGYEKGIREHKFTEAQFELLTPQEKLRLFDLIKENKHLKK